MAQRSPRMSQAPADALRGNERALRPGPTASLSVNADPRRSRSQSLRILSVADPLVIRPAPDTESAQPSSARGIWGEPQLEEPPHRKQFGRRFISRIGLPLDEPVGTVEDVSLQLERGAVEADRV